MNSLTYKEECELLEDARYDILKGLNVLTDMNDPSAKAIKDLTKAFTLLSERSDELHSADHVRVEGEALLVDADDCEAAFDDLKRRVMRYLDSRDRWRKNPASDKAKTIAMTHLKEILPGCVGLFEALRERTAADGCKEEKAVFAEWAARLQ